MYIMLGIESGMVPISSIVKTWQLAKLHAV
jgi:hypothetical protein